MAIIYIPFTPKPADHIEIELENIAWNIFYRWNYNGRAWHMDINSVETGTTLYGVKLVGGGNRLRSHAVTELGGIFVVDTEGKFQDPNYDDFGDRFKVLYVPKAEMNDYAF